MGMAEQPGVHLGFRHAEDKGKGGPSGVLAGDVAFRWSPKGKLEEGVLAGDVAVRGSPKGKPMTVYTGAVHFMDLNGGGGGGKGQSKGKDTGKGVGMDAEEDDSAHGSGTSGPAPEAALGAVAAQGSDSSGEESDGPNWNRLWDTDAVKSGIGNNFIRLSTAPGRGLAIMCNPDSELVYYDFEVYRDSGNTVYTIAEHQFYLYRPTDGDHDAGFHGFATQLEAAAYSCVYPYFMQPMPSFVANYFEQHEHELTDIWQVDVLGDIQPDAEQAEEEDSEQAEEEEQSQPDEVVELQPEPTTGWHELIMSNDGSEPHIILRRRSINGGPGEHYLLMFVMPPASFFLAWHRRTSQVFQVFGNRWEPMHRINFRMRQQPGAEGRKMEIQVVTFVWTWENAENTLINQGLLQHTLDSELS
jgi:hypothetical protein